MTTLLEKAIEKLGTLSKEEQDEYAARLMNAVDSNRKWDDLFAGTTEDQWGKISEMAREDIQEGVVPLRRSTSA